MKKLLQIILVILALVTSKELLSQQYGDKAFYLVDSLDIKQAAKEDIHYVDSILSIYHKEKSDTIKLELIAKVIENIWDDRIWTKYNTYSLGYTTRLLKESKNMDDRTKYLLLNKKAAALGNKGFEYDNKGDYMNAIDYYEQGLAIQIEIGDEKSAATTYSNIGYVYKYMGQIKKALEYYNKALAIQERINEKKGLAYTLNNIGMVFYGQGEYDAALDYYRKSLKIEEEFNDAYSIGNSLNNIAYIFEEKQQYDSVIFYYEKALKLHESIRNTLGMGIVTNNLGKAYLNIKNEEKALEFFEQSVDYLNQLEHPRVAGAYNNMANLFYKKNNISEAKKYGLKGMKIAQKSESLQFVYEAANILSLVYKKENNYKKSLEMYELYILLKDSLLNDDTKRAAIKQNMQYAYEKEALTDSLAFIEKQKIEQIQHNQAMSKQRMYTYIGITGFVLMLLLAIVILKGYHQKKKSNSKLEEKNLIITNQNIEVIQQKNLLEEKNQEIMDSITYAKRIQSAILPPLKVVKEYLQESFILYKPKDIVAGDFYWMETVSASRHFALDEESKNKEEIAGRASNDDIILFAAADCTGHGVPGAMVSVVCNNGLNRSVREFGLTDPGQILDKTRELVIQEFEKSEEDVKDGMDIALCSLEGNKLQYAGAHNPLWIIRNGEIIETRANKQPIGQFDHAEPYMTHTFELQKGDSIYIFSDGYVDQFGGEKGKKFKAKAFRELLLSIQDKTMEEQKILIDEAFETWRGNIEQIDDVCVIGVRV